MGLPKHTAKNALICPAITSPRQTNFFTFIKKDWKELRKSDEKCYMFVCHKPREKLPKEVADYIRWGETECRAKGKGKQMGGKGRLANETEVAKTRAKQPAYFCGWYDLGGIIPVRIFATYYGRYKTRFVHNNFPVAMCHNFIALRPRKNITFNKVQIKALLAYLNSSFAHHHIETNGRYVPKGPMGFEVSVAREMPVLDVRKLDDE